MNGYTFRIWFSGLCHFIPNRDLGARCQLCVVLPEASEGKCYHRGRIHTVARELECGKVRIRPGKRLRKLGGKRVCFSINRFDDLPAFTAYQPVFPAGVIDMEQIAGPFVDENDVIVGLAPKPETVASQLLFENGYYSGWDDASVQRTWRLPGTLTGGAYAEVTVADPVYIEYSGVKSVDMITKPLYGEGPVKHRHLTPHGSVIEILVSNRCVDKNSGKPRKLTLDDLECRVNEDGFEIVQIDKDFAFNYRMLHPTTLASLKKFLPADPVTGEPRYPVPESTLLSVSSTLPICTDDLLAKLKQLFGKYFPGGARLSRFRKARLALRLLDLIPRGTGTGSGSDCLGASGLMRFVNLENTLPPPGPAAVSTSSPNDLSARQGASAESILGNPPRVVRSRSSSSADAQGPTKPPKP